MVVFKVWGNVYASDTETIGSTKVSHDKSMDK